MQRITKAERDAWHRFMAGASGRLSAEDASESDDKARQRALRVRPVPREHLEQIKLIQACRPFWWYRGLRGHNAEHTHGGDNLRGYRAGYRPGQPDITVIVPRPAHSMAVELKSPERRPRREPVAEWWIKWRRQPGDPESRYGLSWDQAVELQWLDYCGWKTLVAYSADEAIEWLSREAGPRPW